MLRTTPGRCNTRRIRYAMYLVACLLLLALCSYIYYRTNRSLGVQTPQAPTTSNTGKKSAGPVVISDAGRSDAQGTVPPASRTATVSGYVEDMSGKRLDAIPVTVRHGDPRQDNSDPLNALGTSTGPDGAFSIAGLEIGETYVLGVDHDGYRVPPPKDNSKTAPNIVCLPEDGLTNVILTVTRAALISGRVVDTSGKPVSRAYLSMAKFKEREEHSYTFCRQGEKGTDREGRFSLGCLDAGRYLIWATYWPRAGQFDWHRSMPLGNDEYPLMEVALREGEWKENVEIRLPLAVGAHVGGIVVDQKGRPIEGAEVYLLTSSGRVVGLMSGKTPASGVFCVDHMISGPPESLALVNLRVQAECKGYERASVDGVAVGARDVRVTMMAEQRGSIAVRLHDAQSKETIRKAKVELDEIVTAWGDVHSRYEAPKRDKPDWTGWFRFDDLPAGTTNIIVTVPQWGVKRIENVVIEANKATELEVPLEGPGAICLRVVRPSHDEHWAVSPTKLLCAGIPSADSSENITHDITMGEGVGPVGRQLACHVTEPAKQWHRNYLLAPGDYTVDVELVAVSQGGGAERYNISIVRHLKVTVWSGELTKVEIPVGNPESEGSVEVEASSPIPIILFSGDNSGLWHDSVLDVEGMRNRQEFQQSGQPAIKHRFPFVSPGVYTVAGFDWNIRGEPRVKSITVTSGQTTAVTFD